MTRSLKMERREDKDQGGSSRASSQNTNLQAGDIPQASVQGKMEGENASKRIRLSPSTATSSKGQRRLRPILPAPIRPSSTPSLSQLGATSNLARDALEDARRYEYVHGPTKVPPEPYATYNSPWTPKKERDNSDTLEPETLEYLTNRLDRVQNAMDRYIDRRGKEALQRSLVSGIDQGEEQPGDDE